MPSVLDTTLLARRFIPHRALAAHVRAQRRATGALAGMCPQRTSRRCRRRRTGPT
jgi:hypothetical protein